MKDACRARCMHIRLAGAMAKPEKTGAIGNDEWRRNLGASARLEGLKAEKCLKGQHSNIGDSVEIPLVGGRRSVSHSSFSRHVPIEWVRGDSPDSESEMTDARIVFRTGYVVMHTIYTACIGDSSLLH